MRFRVVPNPDGEGFLCDIRGRLPNGDRYRRRLVAKVANERQAQEFAAKHWQHVWSETLVSGERRSPRFDDFAERWLREHDTANRHKPSTIRTKRVLLKAHLSAFDDLKLRQIDAGRVAALKAQLADKGLSPKTVNNVLSVLAGLLKSAVEWNELDEAPAVKLVRTEKKRMEFLSVDVYDRLVVGAASLEDKRALVAILLAGDAGLRKGELTALEWERVDLARRVISVELSETIGIVTTTKGRGWRMVPMTDALRDALLSLPHRTGRVLRGRTRTGGIERKTLTELVKDAERAAGLKATGRLHVLRHTYASHLAMAGQSLYHLQAALGHADHGTTQGYAKLHAEALRPLAASIDGRRVEAAKRQALIEAGKAAETKAEVVEAVGIEPSFGRSRQISDDPKEST